MGTRSRFLLDPKRFIYNNILKGHFSTEYIKMARKHEARCALLLFVRENYVYKKKITQ